MKEAYIRLVLEVPLSFRRKLRVLAAENEIAMRDFVILAVNEKEKNDMEKYLR